jgi:hypothetical protein
VRCKEQLITVLVEKQIATQNRFYGLLYDAYFNYIDMTFMLSIDCTDSDESFNSNDQPNSIKDEDELETI